MRPLISIIVPHYTEPMRVGRKLLDMLRLQRGIHFGDLEVILVSDGEENMIPPEELRGYPFQIVDTAIPRRGVSAARNAGLELASGEWVKFCDFDDTFTGIYDLMQIMGAIRAAGDGYDMLWHPYYVEDEKGALTTKGWEPVMLHGKWFRRSFLMEHGIRFSERLRYSEDSAFLAWVDLEITPERHGELHLPFIPYVWCYTEGSVTVDPANSWRNLKGLFERHRWVAELFRGRGMAKEYRQMCTRMLCDWYYHLHREDVPRERLENFELEALEFYQEHRDEIEETFAAPEMEEILECSRRECQKVLRREIPYAKADLRGWIREMEERWITGGDNSVSG